MSYVDLKSFSEAMKDVYAPPGTRLKQWVVDRSREQQWESESCPRRSVDPHDDNTGLPCRNGGEQVPWTYLDHDCCYVCGDLHELAHSEPDIVAWLEEKAKRPPIEQDRSKLSDEIQPDYSTRENPFMSALRGRK